MPFLFSRVVFPNSPKSWFLQLIENMSLIYQFKYVFLQFMYKSTQNIDKTVLLSVII